MITRIPIEDVGIYIYILNIWQLATISVNLHLWNEQLKSGKKSIICSSVPFHIHACLVWSHIPPRCHFSWTPWLGRLSFRCCSHFIFIFTITSTFSFAITTTFNFDHAYFYYFSVSSSSSSTFSSNTTSGFASLSSFDSSLGFISTSTSPFPFLVIIFPLMFVLFFFLFYMCFCHFLHFRVPASGYFGCPCVWVSEHILVVYFPVPNRKNSNLDVPFIVLLKSNSNSFWVQEQNYIGVLLVELGDV